MRPIVYEEAAAEYKPKKIKLLFIAESPPYAREGEEPRYFYFENIKIKDFLFRGMMDVLFPEEYQMFKQGKLNKADLLSRFQKKGYFLVDACDYPINQHKDRKQHIVENLEALVNRLKGLVEKKTKIILIKRNVHDVLYHKLREHGFNVINKEHVDFPACGNQKKFKKKLERLLSS